jgi:hypothetical protein
MPYEEITVRRSRKLRFSGRRCGKNRPDADGRCGDRGLRVGMPEKFLIDDEPGDEQAADDGEDGKIAAAP